MTTRTTTTDATNMFPTHPTTPKPTETFPNRYVPPQGLVARVIDRIGGWLLGAFGVLAIGGTLVGGLLMLGALLQAIF